MGWEKDVDLDKIYYINNGVDLGIYHRQRKEDWLPDEDLDRKDTFKVMYTGLHGEWPTPYRIFWMQRSF